MDLVFQTDGEGEWEAQQKEEKNKGNETKKILFFLISVNVLGKVNGSNFHIIS